jgi:hypothetical protein
MDEMGGACSPNRGEENESRLLVGRPGGRRPLGRPRCRWVDWIGLILERWNGVM